MHYSKIKGHEEILSRFSNYILNNRFEGVYLFNGPMSVGKYTVARSTARYILCSGDKDDSCMCNNCRLFPHVPDYLEISNQENTIKVSDIEPISEFFSLVPYQSDKRVLVIDNIDRLHHAASNRLLKIFEDLKQNNVILLTTSKKHNIYHTILSRTYPVEFHSLKPDDILNILKDRGYGVTGYESLKKLIPHIPRNFLIEYPRYCEIIKKVTRFMKDFPNMPEDEMLSALKAYNDQDMLIHFVDIVIAILNDILKTKFDSVDSISGLEDLEYYEKMVEIWNQDICIMALDKLKSASSFYNRGLYLKFEQYITPVFLWIYTFIQKEKQKSS